MASIIGAFVFGTYSLRGTNADHHRPVTRSGVNTFDRDCALAISEIGNLRTMQKAATEVERATTQEPAAP